MNTRADAADGTLNRNDLEQEVARLDSKRRSGAALSIIGVAVATVGLSLDWHLLIVAGVSAVVTGGLMGASWWSFVRQYRPPNARRLSIEELARQEVLAKDRARLASSES